MQNILLSNGFEIEFSEEVLKETKNLHLKINVAETQKDGISERKYVLPSTL